MSIEGPKARQLQAKSGLDLLVVDYLQLLQLNDVRRDEFLMVVFPHRQWTY
jgi:replicative DNA helicase